MAGRSTSARRRRHPADAPRSRRRAGRSSNDSSTQRRSSSTTSKSASGHIRSTTTASPSSTASPGLAMETQGRSLFSQLDFQALRRSAATRAQINVLQQLLARPRTGPPVVRQCREPGNLVRHLAERKLRDVCAVPVARRDRPRRSRHRDGPAAAGAPNRRRRHGHAHAREHVRLRELRRWLGRGPRAAARGRRRGLL